MWSPYVENDISTLAYLDAEHDFGPGPTRKVFSVIQESLPGFIQILDGSAENAALTYATEKTGRVFSNLTLTNPNNTYRSLGGSESTAIALVCDSSFCSNLVEHLAENTIGPVYIVRNREVANDPGTTNM